MLAGMVMAGLLILGIVAMVGLWIWRDHSRFREWNGREIEDDYPYDTFTVTRPDPEAESETPNPRDKK